MSKIFFFSALLALIVSCNPQGKKVVETANNYARSNQSRELADNSIKPGSSRTAKTVNGTNVEENGDNVNYDMTFAMPKTPQGTPEQVLTNEGYVSSFNNQTLLPNWVAWKLTDEHTKGTAKRKEASFTPDDRIDDKYRVTTYDYMRSGYDRGHMCPAGDNKWSYKAMQQCFLMTNMCPQDHGLNVGDWNEMENQCRKWAEKYGEIYIVCGPILFKGNHKRIGQQHKVTVPEAFFKVVLCLKGKPKGIGFIYRNEDGNRPKGDYVNTIDQVERITGLDFFPTLPDKTEKDVEAYADLSEW